MMINNTEPDSTLSSRVSQDTSSECPRDSPKEQAKLNNFLSWSAATINNSSENEKPNSMQRTYGLSGIFNTGNTCYMNSAIQVLSRNYPLTSYLFNNKERILCTLKSNARKILKDHPSFQDSAKDSLAPLELRSKIQNPDYNQSMLNSDEESIVLNHTITAQLLKLLEKMWERNCVVIPTSFKKVFGEARDKFFYGFDQHDAEEAYSCILQKMQEELGEEKNIKFRTSRQSVQDFLQFKNKISEQIKRSTNDDDKRRFLEIYKQKKREMPTESLTIEAFREMQKYYGSSYSRVMEIFTGFLHSSIVCPDSNCAYTSNKFDPYTHLSLPIPPKKDLSSVMTIYDCMNEYCKEETLDEENLWLCEGCNQRVKIIKKIRLWTAPPVLVIQIKRFGSMRAFKDNRLVKYPLDNFNISSLMSPTQVELTKCNTYRLQSVINHTGSLNSGHYYSYCLDEDSNIWYDFDDDTVNPVSQSRIVTHTAYLLIYIRKDLIKYEC